MRTNKLPSYEILHELFELKDGQLFRKKSVSNNTKVGDKVGTLTAQGYVQVKIKGKLHSAHHIVYKMTNNREAILLDHIDGNKSNNKIDNLREVTKSQNAINSKGRDNKSGCKNVLWQKSRQNWLVKLHINGKQKYIGEFKDIELAELVAIEARNKFHKEFANHGTH
jgi:hypothetical protein